MSDSDDSSGVSMATIPMFPMMHEPSAQMAMEWGHIVDCLRPLLRLPSVEFIKSTSRNCTVCAKGYAADFTMLELLDSAFKLRCGVCLVRIHGLLRSVDWLRSYGWHSVTLHISSRGPIMRIRGVVDSGVVHSATVLLYTKDDEPRLSWEIIGVHRELGSRRDTYPAIVSQWLKTCQEEHPVCSSREETALPLRVLDVGEVGSDSVHLRIFPIQEEKGRYAALSHCWGGHLAMTTTTDTLEARQRAISFSDLPQTFKDAVEITRGIGLRFLWIDALCILQDSKEDWELESGKMAGIYRDAWVVLSADMSSSSSTGFLHSDKINRKIRKQQHYYGREGPGVEIAKVESDGTLIFARVHRLHQGFGTMFYHDEFNARGRMPLHTRAWTLQEQLLASRVVHFTSLELVWECTSQVRCECMESEQALKDERSVFVPSWYTDIPGFPSTYRPRVQLARCLHTGDQRALYTMWQSVVGEVMSRNMTKQSDILPAIAGIADLFQRHGAGDYLAGLWREDLPHGLLWCFPSRSPGRAASWRGPSWSWASISTDPESERCTISPGNLNPAWFEIETFCRVLEAHCTPSGLNKLGEVSDGRLKLHAPMLEVRHDGLAIDGYSNTSFVPVRRTRWRSGLPTFYILWDDTWGEGPAQIEERKKWLREGKFRLLFIRGKTERVRAGGERSEGLVLRQRPDVAVDTFERVGYFRTLARERNDEDKSWRGRLSKSSKDWVYFAKKGTVNLI